MKNPELFRTAAIGEHFGRASAPESSNLGSSGLHAAAAQSRTEADAAPAPAEPQPTPPTRESRQTELPPLALLVRERLTELGLRQAEFCRKYRFDQGLLSKLQNGMITNLSLESVLRLAVGLAVPPRQILTLLNRLDLHDLIFQAYGGELTKESTDTPQQ